MSASFTFDSSTSGTLFSRTMPQVLPLFSRLIGRTLEEEAGVRFISAADDPELHVVARLTIDGVSTLGLIAAGLSGLTMTLFPAYGSEEFALDVTVTDRDGAGVGVYRSRGSVGSIIQLVFVVTAFSADVSGDEDETVRAIARDVASRLRRDLELRASGRS